MMTFSLGFSNHMGAEICGSTVRTVAMTEQAAQAFMLEVLDLVAQGDAAALAQADQTYFVRLTENGPSRIDHIKTLRAHLDLPLKEAKELTEYLPKVVMETKSLSAADALVRELRDRGAVVEMNVRGGAR